MAGSFDLSPTAALGGLHARGVVERRFLITYPVSPVVLEPSLPPGSEPSLWRGEAWVSACYVRLRDLRPSVAPRGTGLSLRYLIHRTRARVPFPDGKLREAVLVLEASIDRRLPAVLARLTTGVPFQVRRIGVVEDEQGWRVSMRDSRRTLFDAELPRASFGAQIPDGSRFESVREAEHFLLGVAYGCSWDRRKRRLHLLAETHDPWDTGMGTCITHEHAFLEGLGTAEPRADHALTMVEVPHYFALRSRRVNDARRTLAVPRTVRGPATSG